MSKKIITRLGLSLGISLILATPLVASAKVFMCVDPQTGKKTFTDRACPDTEPGKKVRIEPVNFGSGKSVSSGRTTWNSDRDASVSGNENYSASERNNPGPTVGYVPAQ